MLAVIDYASECLWAIVWALWQVLILDLPVAHKPVINIHIIWLHESCVTLKKQVNYKFATTKKIQSCLCAVSAVADRWRWDSRWRAIYMHTPGEHRPHIVSRQPNKNAMVEWNGRQSSEVCAAHRTRGRAVRQWVCDAISPTGDKLSRING